MVVADSRHLAEDAVALVEVDYEPLPALADCREALNPAAPKVRLEATDNVLTRFTIAYPTGRDCFSRAAHPSRRPTTSSRGFRKISTSPSSATT